jgi:ATP-binding cassette subfamily F protein uup
LEKRQRARAPVVATRESAAVSSPRKSAAISRVPATKPARPRKLSFAEARELGGMEARILATETDIARIEALFATPDFHRTHGAQAHRLVAELAAAKEDLTRLYARWEELEAVREAASLP